MHLLMALITHFPYLPLTKTRSPYIHHVNGLGNPSSSNLGPTSFGVRNTDVLNTSTLVILCFALVFTSTLKLCLPSIQYHQGWIQGRDGRRRSTCRGIYRVVSLHGVPPWTNHFCSMTCNSLAFLSFTTY